MYNNLYYELRSVENSLFSYVFECKKSNDKKSYYNFQKKLNKNTMELYLLVFEEYDDFYISRESVQDIEDLNEEKIKKLINYIEFVSVQELEPRIIKKLNDISSLFESLIVYKAIA